MKQEHVEQRNHKTVHVILFVRFGFAFSPNVREQLCFNRKIEGPVGGFKIMYSLFIGIWGVLTAHQAVCVYSTKLKVITNFACSGQRVSLVIGTGPCFLIPTVSASAHDTCYLLPSCISILFLPSFLLNCICFLLIDS